MKDKLMPRLLCIFLASLAFLTGCQKMPSSVNIQTGQQGEQFKKKYSDAVLVEHHPAGLDFYQVNWTSPSPGTVVLEHGKFSITIPNVLSITGTQDSDFPEEGISDWAINAGITAPSLIDHDEARQKFHAILQNIVRAGWKIVIDRGHPRLRGRDQLNYVMKVSGVGSLDANYEPTFDEWMHLEDLSTWTFYADHTYLTVDFQREPALQRDPHKPGTYLLKLKIYSENAYFSLYVDSHDYARWKELLPTALDKLLVARAKSEAEMGAKGIGIDETYQDPPVPDFVKKASSMTGNHAHRSPDKRKTVP